MKGKARLGTVVHQKTAAILTFTDVRPEDKNALATLSATIKVVPLYMPFLICSQIITTSSSQSTLVTGVEENSDKRAWTLKPRRQRLPLWLSRSRGKWKKCCSGSTSSTSKAKLLHHDSCVPSCLCEEGAHGPRLA